jgi:MFS family permease
MSRSSALTSNFPFRSLPRNVWAVTLTSFLTDISSEMLATLLPLFLTNTLGARTVVVGLIEGVAETTASLMKVFAGWLSDRLGQRKWLTVGGYALSTVSKGLLFFANAWGWVLGSRFGDRLGKGLRTAPRDALLADSVAPGQRGLAFGLHRAGDTTGGVGGLLAALAVVWFAERNATSLTQPVFQLLVALSLIPAALAVLVLALGARDTTTTRPAKPPQLTLAPFDRRFRYFLLVVLVFTLGNSSDAFLVLRAQAAGLPLVGVLGMMITFNAIYAGLSGPAGALSDRIGRRRLMLGGWLLYGLVYLGFAQATAGWQAWALMAVYGAYYALTEGVAKAFVADLVPAELRGTAYGVFNAAVGLMAFPASFLAGLLWQGALGWEGFGPGAPFYFGAALALVAAAMLAAMPRGAAQ